LLGVPEVARRLGRSTEQVRRYLREGRLGGRRIGNQWFIAAEALAAFRAAQVAQVAQANLGDDAGFVAQIRPSDVDDPLADTIGLARGDGGRAIAEGKDAYRRAGRTRWGG